MVFATASSQTLTKDKVPPIVVQQNGNLINVITHGQSRKQVLERISEAFSITVIGAEQLDLSDSLQGVKSGTLVEIIKWLLASQDFALFPVGERDDSIDTGIELQPKLHLVLIGNGSAVTPSTPDVAEKLGSMPLDLSSLEAKLTNLEHLEPTILTRGNLEALIRELEDVCQGGQCEK